MEVLTRLMERKLEITIDWLKKSGMKVNEAKTDLCLFHARDTTPISVNINRVSILTKKNKLTYFVYLPPILHTYSLFSSVDRKRRKSMLKKMISIRGPFHKT